MPRKKTEEKGDEKLRYLSNIGDIISDFNYYYQNLKFVKAFQCLRILYSDVRESHREAWLDKIAEKNKNETNFKLKRKKARKMLTSKNPLDHYVNRRQNRRWMEMKMAFRDMCQDKSLHFSTREIEVGGRSG